MAPCHLYFVLPCITPLVTTQCRSVLFLGLDGQGIVIFLAALLVRIYPVSSRQNIRKKPMVGYQTFLANKIL